MENKRYFRCFALALSCAGMLVLGGCGGNVKDSVRGTLGLNREIPDEFKVITRAPLEIPKNLTLPPPMPGMHHPQEKPVLIAAKEAVFGEENKQGQSTDSGSDIEAILLERAGADQNQANIRAMVNQETKEIAEQNIPVAKKLLGLSGGEVKPAATIVDAKAEYERIKKNLEEGKSVLEGETPMIKDY